MTIPLNFGNKETEELFRKYAERKHVTVSEMIRTIVMEHIEDELDMEVYMEAMFEFQKNPVTYSLEQVKKELNIDDEV